MLEGDGFCILKAYDLIEKVRAFGRSLHEQSSMPNTAAVIRKRCKLVDGVKFRQYWSEKDAPEDHGWWTGKILGKNPGHGDLCAVKYSNGAEMWIKKKEELEFRANILANELPEWKEAVDKVTPAFVYITNRLTNECDAPYHMQLQHQQMTLLDAGKCAAL